MDYSLHNLVNTFVKMQEVNDLKIKTSTVNKLEGLKNNPDNYAKSVYHDLFKYFMIQKLKEKIEDKKTAIYTKSLTYDYKNKKKDTPIGMD